MVTDRDRENGTEPSPSKSFVTSDQVSGSSSSNNDTGSATATRDEVPNNEMIPLKAPPSALAADVELNVNDGLDDGSDEFGDLDDLCEVVLSFKCRHCSFLCQDKGALTFHVKSCHNDGKVKKAVLKILSEDDSLVGKRTLESNDKSNECESECLLKKNGVHKVELPPTPSIPATPDAVLVEDSISPEEEERLGIDDQVEDVFLCAECDIVFASKELCCSHMHEIHDLTQFNADFIQDEIISKKPAENLLPKRRLTRLPKHLTTEEGTVVPKRFRVTKEVFYTCSKCSIRFESNEVTKFHEQCHTKEDTSDDSSNRKTSKGGFVCPVCEGKNLESLEVFAKWGLCAGHLWRDHKIDCELYTCTVCKQFKSNLITRVKEHERLHMKQSVFLCKTCKKTFKQLKQLRCHEKFHKEKMTKLPPPTDSRWYTPKECHICKRILSDAKCLKKHISAVHNKLKPYCCNICGHMTARKAELQLHMRIHTQEKPYKCPSCDFSTGDHNSLRKHKLRHSDKRPYVCPYCDYRCIQSCAFKKHILAVHPGQEVVFVCQLCSHASVNEILFAVHQKDHAEGRLPSEIQSAGLNNSPEAQEKESNEIENDVTSNLNSLKKPSQPSWLEEDSMDVVDTGGVTIPASPVEPESREVLDPEVEKTTEDANGVTVNEPIVQSVLDNGKEKTIDLTRNNVVSLASGPIQHMGQTTYILLPPNTPLPFLTNASLPRPSQSLVNNQTISENNSILVKGKSNESCNGDTNHRPTGTVFPVTVQENEQKKTNSTDAANDEDSRAFIPFSTSNSGQLLENMPHLDALDLAEVINACNQPSSSNDSMFEKLLGMSGGM